MELQVTAAKLSGDPERDVKTLSNHVFQLEEQLRYQLRNLDVTNFNDLGLARYENGRLQFYSEQIQIQAEKIAAELGKENEKIYAKIELTASNLRAEFQQADSGLESKIELTASGLRIEFEKADAGLSNKIEVTAQGLQANINSVDGKYTTLSATVNGLTTTVSSHTTSIGTMQSQIQQTSSSISAIVASVGTDGKVTAASIALAITNDQSAISLLAENIELRADYVTFTDLQGEGTTTINGKNITTGEITAVNFIAKGNASGGMSNSFVVQDHNNYRIGRIGYLFDDTDGFESGHKLYLETEYFYNDWEDVEYSPAVKIHGAGGVSVETNTGYWPVYISAGGYITLDAPAIYIRDNAGTEWRFQNGSLYKDGQVVL